MTLRPKPPIRSVSSGPHCCRLYRQGHALLTGAHGYLLEHPIARMYADARVSRIYGGSGETMKVVIAKDFGL